MILFWLPLKRNIGILFWWESRLSSVMHHLNVRMWNQPNKLPLCIRVLSLHLHLRFALTTCSFPLLRQRKNLFVHQPYVSTLSNSAIIFQHCSESSDLVYILKISLSPSKISSLFAFLRILFTASKSGVGESITTI